MLKGVCGRKRAENIVRPVPHRKVIEQYVAAHLFRCSDCCMAAPTVDAVQASPTQTCPQYAFPWHPLVSQSCCVRSASVLFSVILVTGTDMKIIS